MGFAGGLKKKAGNERERERERKKKKKRLRVFGFCKVVGEVVMRWIFN